MSHSSIQIELEGDIYVLSEDLVTEIIKCLMMLDDDNQLVESIDDLVSIDVSFFQDVKLLLEEVESCLVEE